MWLKAEMLSVSSEEREILRRFSQSRNLPHKLVLRARIIRGAVEGLSNHEIARRCQTSRPTVIFWRKRFSTGGRLKALERDEPRPGRLRRISPEKIKQVVEATLHSKPEAATHWSVRTMAEAQGLSHMAIHRIWKAHGLKPHLIKTFKLSRDKQFVEKLRDVVGLYLNPPDKSLVLCVDGKSQIQALDRTQPGLPLKKGRCGTMTHDYKRNGTTTLFAALNILEGKVMGYCLPRHRHQEFLKFLGHIEQETPAGLDLRLIMDNYGTHKHPRVQRWIKRHPRFHFHFTPTSSSWLNLVERWFREITDKRIRRGSFSSVAELIKAIEGYIEQNNKNPKPFVWTASADKILEKIQHCKEALVTLH
jgi:transposase